MSKNNSNNSKSSSQFNNYASGIKFKYKYGQKFRRSDFILGDERSVNIELEEKPELCKKHKNEIEFKPSTKQPIDQNKYKAFKKKYNIEEEIDEREEYEQLDEKNSIKNKKNQVLPSKIRTSIYTKQDYKEQKNKIIEDENDNEKEDKIKMDDKIKNSLNNNQNEDNDIESKYDYKVSKGVNLKEEILSIDSNLKKIKIRIKKLNGMKMSIKD